MTSCLICFEPLITEYEQKVCINDMCGVRRKASTYLFHHNGSRVLRVCCNYCFGKICEMLEIQ